MSKKKKQKNVPNDKNGGLEYVCPAASATDMTGLVPARCDGSGDSYDQLYEFRENDQKH